MRHTLIVLFGLLLIGLISCGSTEQKETDLVKSEEVVGSTFHSIKVNIEAPKIDFTELVESVEVLRLEETDKSLLGSASNLTITDDYIVTCKDRDGDFYIFDRNGNFIKSFNPKGNGPEEVVRIWGFWVEEDRILVHDAGRSEIVAYSMGGGYLDKFHLPYEQTNHVKKDGDYLWIDISTVILEDSVMAQLSRYSIDTGEDSLFLLQSNRQAFDMPSSMNSFSPYGNDMIFKRFLSDSAYLVKNGSVDALIHFDFGDEFLWQGEASKVDPKKGFEMLQSTEKIWQVWPFIGSEWVYLRYHRSMRAPAKYMVINLKTGVQYEIDKPSAAKAEYFYNERLWFDSQFVIDMNSTDVATFLDKLDKSQVKFHEGSSLAEIESSENPALLFITFKNTLN